MVKVIKGFITRDDFIDNAVAKVAPIYEISEQALTYSIDRKQYYFSLDTKYSLYTFRLENVTNLSQEVVDNIILVVKELADFLTATTITEYNQQIIAFTNHFNRAYPTLSLSEVYYTNILEYKGVKSPDFVSFRINDFICSIWLSNDNFIVFYPDYDIKIVFPFDNFPNIINSTSLMLESINNFSLISFNEKIETMKNNIPPTYTRIINIPYKVPNTNITKDCYFAFIIYGIQGNYDFILKIKLFEHLTSELNVDSNLLEVLFPTILNINEFFVIPRWDRFAIPSFVGQNGINSQITLTYNETFDLDKFIRVYNDNQYLRLNSYNVPFDYNNLLLTIVNGKYTEESLRDFKNYYSDLITVTSMHPDFARMSQRTQRFVTLLENMLYIADSGDNRELYNKILANTSVDFKFNVVTRQDVFYLTCLYDKHQYFLIPKYEYYRVK